MKLLFLLVLYGYFAVTAQVVKEEIALEGPVPAQAVEKPVFPPNVLLKVDEAGSLTGMKVSTIQIGRFGALARFIPGITPALLSQSNPADPLAA